MKSPAPPALTPTLRTLEKGMRWHVQGDFSRAGDLYDQILAEEPRNRDALYLRAQTLIELDQFDGALKLLTRLSRVNPNNPELSFLIALNYFHLRRYFDATKELRAALKVNKHERKSLLLLARINASLGLRGPATQLVAEVHRLPPTRDPSERITLAKVQAALGQIEEARSVLLEMISQDDQPAEALFDLSLLPGDDVRDEVLARLDALLAASPTERQQMLLHFAAGSLLHRIGRYNEAFRHFTAANGFAGRAFDIPRYAATVETLTRTFNASFVAARSALGLPDQLPVFIVGMPRSGKSSVERYLAGHPHVAGAGEIGLSHLLGAEYVVGLDGSLPEGYEDRVASISRGKMQALGNRYLTELRRYSPASKRITNSLPQNFQNIGLLSILYRNARFIVVQRDPLDTCLSCFMKNFKNRHDYASDLGSLGAYYRLYERLVDHWEQVLGGRLLRVRYEDFVAGPAAVLNEILEFLGVDPEVNLIDPAGLPLRWSQETELGNGPISDRYVGVSRNYESQLARLRAALADSAVTGPDQGPST
jgi:tetratricopeptide (TPR) repeat protein